MPVLHNTSTNAARASTIAYLYHYGMAYIYAFINSSNCFEFSALFCLFYQEAASI